MYRSNKLSGQKRIYLAIFDDMNTTLTLLIRALLIITSIALLVLCAGFLLGNSYALDLWPWPDGQLSYIFVASILAAIGAPVLWMGLTGELAGMRGGALDFMVTYIGLSVTLLLFGDRVSEMISVSFFTTLTVVAVLINVLIYFMVAKRPFNDQRPVPWLLRASFVVFFLLLVGVGIALITGYQTVFPWPLQAQTSVVFGWIFMGAATYFFYGLLQPYWGNFCGQLIGFLAYDLVLLVPFIQHLNTVKADHQLSLYVYTSILLYSALVSVYFLFIHPTTRFGSNQKVAGMG